jgi:hypothetical protein
MNTPQTHPKLNVVVIGAGAAGAFCAQALRHHGHAVHVVDKSRGAGGRLASKRLEWTDLAGQARLNRIDHGAPGFAVESAAFADDLAPLLAAERLLPWLPTLKPGSGPAGDAGPLLVPQPDMPALCRSLLSDTAVTWSFQVDRLRHSADGWRVEAAGVALPGRHDAVVLALPPAQAAPLLASLAPAWASSAAAVMMQPCWTLMGVAQAPTLPMAWDLALPTEGPLAAVIRADARPGRATTPGQAHWVAHARAGWSRTHLEQPVPWVRGELEAALQACVGEAIVWEHAIVHRWRYARLDHGADAAGHRSSDTTPCWWDPTRRLGVCGDFLGGGDVEGAWRSARALSATILAG